MDVEITTETDGEQYADILVNGTGTASVDIREKDGQVSVKVIDPDEPGEALDEYRYPIPE